MPLDMNILTSLKRSSLSLDLYLWLWFTGPSHFVLRSGSPGRTSTASLERLLLWINQPEAEPRKEPQEKGD